MKPIKRLLKFFSENDTAHSLMRLMSFISLFYAMYMSTTIIDMNYKSIPVDESLYRLNVYIYLFAFAGKSIQKFIESELFKKLVGKIK